MAFFSFSFLLFLKYNIQNQGERMEVYIEYVIIDNFIVDMLILLFTCIVLGSKVNKFRLILSTLIGVVGAIFMPLIFLSGIVMLVIKLLLGVLMVAVLKKYPSFSAFFAHLIMFFTFTFVFGGLCYGLCLLLGGSALGVLINAYQFPMGLIILVIATYLYLLWKLLLYVRHKNKNISLYYDVILKVGNEKHYIRGYVDSGNSMYDDGKPIIVISFSAFCKMFRQFPYQNLLLCKTDKIPLKNAHFIDYSTAGGDDKMLVFEIDEIIYKNTDRKENHSKNICVGVSKTCFHSDYDCLLHNEFLMG